MGDNHAVDVDLMRGWMLVMFKQYKSKVKSLLSSGMDIKQLLACVCDLYQDGLIDENQELELYEIIDPDELYNDVEAYWMSMDFENPLLAQTSEDKRMDKSEFLVYVQENFSISGEALRLIDNIVNYITTQNTDAGGKYLLAHTLLDGAIGLTDEELHLLRL